MRIFGIDFFDKDKEGLIKIFYSSIIDKKKTKVAFCDLNMLGEYLENRSFANKLNDFDIIMADGSVILFLKKIFFPKRYLKRIPGPDFFKFLIEADSNFTHYFLGSSDNTLEKVCNKVKKINPDIKISGIYSPPYEKNISNISNNTILEKINNSTSDIVWVSFGCPKQEKWIHNNSNKINAGIIIGIGAALDFYSGNVKRAPYFFRKFGFEFLFRLFIQPRIILRVIKGSFRILKNIYKVKV